MSVVEKSNANHKVWKEDLRVASLLVEARIEGRKEGRKEGKLNGISIGERRGKLAIAANMLRDGKLTTEEIIFYTGLTHDQISMLKSGELPIDG